MTAHLVLVGWVGLLNLCVPLAVTEDAREQTKLKGVWKIVAIDANKQTVFPRDMESPWGHGWVVVRENTFRVFDTDGYHEAWSFRLDPTRNPVWVDLIEVKSQQVYQGVYLLKGSRLTLCISTRDGQRPAALTPAPGTHKVPLLFATLDVPVELRIEMEQVDLEALRPDEVTRKEQAKLEGNWKLVEAEQGGKPVPPEQVEQLGMTVRIQQGKVTVHWGDQGRQLATMVRLIPGGPLGVMDLVMAHGEFAKLPYPAIYLLQGDTLKVQFGDERTGKRPLVLETTAGDKDSIIYTLRRVKP